MKPQNELALIVAYYLSRLDKESYGRLGYKTFNEAARELGSILDVKPTTLKNMRDEFDYHLQNSRIGWRRELRGSRLKVVQAFQLTEDSELLQIVKEILENKDMLHTDAYHDIHLVLSDEQNRTAQAREFVSRGPTGRAAEEFYIAHFNRYGDPAKGELIDCRDLGCGYDFRIEASDGRHYFVEVKGLAAGDGGVLFTDKEWQTAVRLKGDYYLAVIKHVSSNPEIKLIQDPASKMSPTRNIYTTVQVSWAVAANSLV